MFKTVVDDIFLRLKYNYSISKHRIYRTDC